MKAVKQTRLLPGRGALNDLGKTQRTIMDYSKISPIGPTQPNPATILNLAQKMPK